MRMLFLVCVPQSLGFLDERLLLAVAQDPATKYNSQSPVLLLNARNMYLLKSNFMHGKDSFAEEYTYLKI